MTQKGQQRGGGERSEEGVSDAKASAQRQRNGALRDDGGGL